MRIDGRLKRWLTAIRSKFSYISGLTEMALLL